MLPALNDPTAANTARISPDGKIIYRETGSADPLPLKQAIQQATNERKLRKTTPSRRLDFLETA